MDESKHGPMPGPSAQTGFQLAPDIERGFRHQLPHGNAAGDEIPEWHERPDGPNLKLGKSRFEEMPVALKDDPRQSAVRAGERTRFREAPILRIGVKGLVVEMGVDWP